MIKFIDFKDKLQFGTGGVRGVLGDGPLKFNSGIVKNVVKALLTFLKEDGEHNPRIVIAYDTRHNSDLFSSVAAIVIDEAGGKPLLFDKPVPTPALSYGIRHFNAAAGIVITASHNPAEYNGIKLYLGDGGQLVSPDDKRIAKFYNSFEWEPFDINYNIKNGNKISSAEFLDKYIRAAASDVDQFISTPELLGSKKIKVAYTPLHGTGINTVPEIIKLAGADPLILVSQSDFNPEFPGMEAPNPENESVMKAVIEFAKKNNCVAALATDPDCDRLGLVFIDDQKREYQLTGNELSALFLDFLIKNSTIEKKRYVVNSIVSTDLIEKIASVNNIEAIRTLTGFKYVGREIKTRNLKKEGQFLFAAEESFGFLAGDSVRDKDATQASYLTCLLIRDLLENNQTPYERLEDIQRQYGFHSEKLVAVKCEGQDNSKITEFMKKIRTSPEHIYNSYFKNICSDTLEFDQINNEEKRCFWKIIDLNQPGTVNRILREAPNYSIEQADVFIYSGSGWRVTIRPSGTEPKIKFYLMAFSKKGEPFERGPVSERLIILQQAVENLKSEFLK